MTEERFHEVAQLFPMVATADLEDLASDIAANGLQSPIWLHPDGRIIDGRNRFMACRKAGVVPEYRTWQEDRHGPLVPFVLSLNLHRRHLTESQRAMVAARVAKLGNGQRKDSNPPIGEAPALTQQEAADKLKVGKRSLERARNVQDRGVPELGEAVDSGELAVSRAAEIARQAPEQQRQALASAREALHSSETNEWYTPAEYADAARELMGAIDLDPASCPEANKVIRAKRYYTAQDDGLSARWSGRVWLNPPYGRGENNESNAARWLYKLLEHYEEGQVQQAVMLVNATTDRRWFYPLWERPICFVSQRIKFWRPGEVRTQPTNANALVYFGGNTDMFSRVFEKFGQIVVPHDGFCLAMPGASGGCL